MNLSNIAVQVLSSRAARLQRIRAFLSRLSPIRSIAINGRSEKLFELECYLRTLTRLSSLNRQIAPVNLLPGNLFRPLYNPGNIGSASYFTLTDPQLGGATMNLYLNVRIEGRNGVFHSPDILLTSGNQSEILSIYECKLYGLDLGIAVYREFIGYLTELGLGTGRGRRGIRQNFPAASPRIYTTASALAQHLPMTEAYGFNVEDNLP